LEIRFLRFLYFPMKNIHEDVQNQEPDLLQATSLPPHGLVRHPCLVVKGLMQISEKTLPGIDELHYKG
jgi:hypothetical protein